MTTPTLTVVLPAGLDQNASESYFETESTRRGVLLLNTALVLHNACEDAYGDWEDYSWWYGPADSENRELYGPI